MVERLVVVQVTGVRFSSVNPLALCVRIWYRASMNTPSVIVHVEKRGSGAVPWVLSLLLACAIGALGWWLNDKLLRVEARALMAEHAAMTLRAEYATVAIKLQHTEAVATGLLEVLNAHLHQPHGRGMLLLPEGETAEFSASTGYNTVEKLSMYQTQREGGFQ